MDPKVVLITGGARGIGKGIALELATRGWSVAICYRTSEQDSTATTQAIVEQGGQGFADSLRRVRSRGLPGSGQTSRGALGQDRRAGERGGSVSPDQLVRRNTGRLVGHVHQ